MVCFCCSTNGDSNEEVGNCIQCHRNACDYFANGHGEECVHCQKFYCYMHQHEHSSDIDRDPRQIFPKTFRKAFEILENLSNNPMTFQKPRLALNHGVFLAKKMKNMSMEREFLDMISTMEKSSTDNISSLTHVQSDMQAEMTNKFSNDIPKMLKSIGQF